jgi:hypothetical protein
MADKKTITAVDLMAAIRDGFEAEPICYSGRFMYGKRCVAVTVPSGGELLVGLKVLASLVLDADDDDVHELLFAAQNLMAGARTDSMGRDEVVVYWPRVEWDALAASDMGLEDEDGGDADETGPAEDAATRRRE